MLKRLDGVIADDAFALKYLAEIRISERAFGLAGNPNQIDDESMFEYEHIETAATPTVPSDTGDLGDQLETLWPLTLNFHRALRSHWRTTQLYDFHPHLVA